jgi:hypothetical protein
VKDKNKQTEVLTEAVNFDHQLIQSITFDLLHINQGWDDENHDYSNRKRSSYTAADIVDFFEQFKYYSVEWIIGLNKESIKIKGVPHHRYYWETTDEYGDTVRVVLDLPHIATGEGIIVTVFKP